MLSTLLEAVSIVAVAVGLAVSALGSYLVVLAIAELAGGRQERPRAPEKPARRIVVLIPAHNEEVLIGRCLDSLSAQTYPRELFEVVVVADNCTDRTAEIAAGLGAAVMVRESAGQRGKGHALRWASDKVLAQPRPPDALVVVDADSIADPNLLRSLEAALARGAEAAQAEYAVLVEQGSRREALTAIGFTLFHRVRLGGRAVLGLPANLVGNGMLFTSNLLKRHPWDSFTGTEDLEYTVQLRLGGTRPRFVREALVRGPVPAGRAGATEQRLRWEGGRFHIQRAYLGRLLRTCIQGPERPWDMLLDLAVPPLGLLSMAAAVGCLLTLTTAAVGVLPWWTVAPWAASAVSVPLFVVLGMVATGAPARSWAALVSAPLFLAWKVAAYAHLLRGFDANRWVRSERPPASAAPEPGDRFNLLGVPIDPVDMEAALARAVDALEGRSLFQIATLNLDFVVSAQRRPDVRRIFSLTALNLADGAPVVWLGRLLGRAVPERVAGADLVPRLFEATADRGLRVYLLGGEGGSATGAAQAIARRFPGVVVAGVHEPPRAAIEEMDNDAILRHVSAVRPDVLLVALGHPKQERWIDRHRDRLQVPVAIGVGCVFDLLAERVSRAPQWMQRAGLEWLFRVVNEPGRLLGRYAMNARWLMLLTTRVLLQRFAL